MTKVAIREGVFETNSSSTHGFVKVPGATKSLSYYPFEVSSGSFGVSLNRISFENNTVYTQLEHKIAALMAICVDREDLEDIYNITKEGFLKYFEKFPAIMRIIRFLERMLGVPIDFWPSNGPTDLVRLGYFDGGYYGDGHLIIQGDFSEMLEKWTESQLHRFFLYSDQGLYIYRDESGVNAKCQLYTGETIDFLANARALGKQDIPGTSIVALKLVAKRVEDFDIQVFVKVSDIAEVPLDAYLSQVGIHKEGIVNVMVYSVKAERNRFEYDSSTGNTFLKVLDILHQQFPTCCLDNFRIYNLSGNYCVPDDDHYYIAIDAQLFVKADSLVANKAASIQAQELLKRPNLKTLSGSDLWSFSTSASA